MPAFATPPSDGPYEEKNEAGVVKTRGQHAGGKRVGTWTWFHDSGERLCEGDYVDGKQQGPETTWYATGEVEAQGDYLDDERHGTWLWTFPTGERKGLNTYDRGKKDGPYEWWHTPQQRHSLGTYRNDKHFGSWTWWREDGGIDTLRGYTDEGRKHGLEETYYDNGKLKTRYTWERGQLVGLCESFYEDGKPKERAHYLGGEYDGTVESWDERGKKTSAEFVRGMPKQLDKKKLAAVAKKIKSKKDGYDKMDAAGELVDHGAREALLLRLHEEGFLHLGTEPMLWEKLDRNMLTGEQLASILSGITTYSPGKDYSLNLLTADWPLDLDELAVNVYARDPAPLEAAWPSFPAPVRKGFATVRLRFGKCSADELEGNALEDLAKQHVKDHGLSHHLWMPDAEGKAVKLRLYDDAQQPNEHFYAFVQLFGERKAWNKLVLKLAQKHGGNYPKLYDAFINATPKQLEKLFDRCSLSIASLYHCFDTLRHDSVKDLVGIAERAKKDDVREIAAICAMRRLAAAGESIPDELDAKLEFKGYQSSVGTPLFEGLSQTIEALQALPSARAHAIIARGLEHEYLYGHPIPVLGVIADEDLRGRAFARIEESAKAKYYNMQFMAHALAYWGEAELPRLHAQLQAASDEPLRDTYRRAILIALASLADAGTTWDEKYDGCIEFYEWSSSIDDHQYEHYIQPFILRAIRGLPGPRTQALLLRALAPSVAFTRPFTCLPTVKDTKVWRAAFGLLLDHGAKIKASASYAVQAALRDMGSDADDWVRWCVHNEPSPKLIAIFKEAFYDFDDRLKRWAEASGGDASVPEALHKVDELVAQIESFAGGGERTRIYLLKNVDTKPDDSLNQIGGCPPGITADSWPMYEGEPMEHLFTLDLDTMPEARGPESKTRAVAMFISNARSNEAWEPDNEHTALIRLTNEEVANGRLDAPPGAATKLGYFVPVPADVPVDVFDEELPEDSELRELRRGIYGASARVLGSPIWLQDSEHFGFLLMQFDEGFVDINLGDSGVMYVFSDAQFWQCH